MPTVKNVINPEKSAKFIRDVKSKDENYLSRMNNIGPAIKKWRVEISGLSQERMAADLSTRLKERISQSYVSHAENGDHILSLPRFLAICDTLSVGPSELLSTVRV